MRLDKPNRFDSVNQTLTQSIKLWLTHQDQSFKQDGMHKTLICVLTERKKWNLRESGALGPNAAVVADDGGGREVVAFNFAHQMVVYIGLPRHLCCCCWFWGFLFLGFCVLWDFVLSKFWVSEKERSAFVQPLVFYNEQQRWNNARM